MISESVILELFIDEDGRKQALTLDDLGLHLSKTLRLKAITATQDFSPAHTGCRCFPRPFLGDVSTPPEIVQMPPPSVPMVTIPAPAPAPAPIVLQKPVAKPARPRAPAKPRAPRAPKPPSDVLTPGMKLKPRKAANDFMSGISAKSYDAKSQVSQKLGARMAGNPDWEEYKGRMRGTMRSWGISDDADLASHLVEKWAHTSGDHDPLSISMQISAHREFGLRPESLRLSLDHLTEDMRNQALAIAARDGPAQQAFLRAMHTETQEQLAAAGIKEVSLMRGQAVTSGRHPDWVTNTPELQTQNRWGDTVLVDGKVIADSSLRPMSSFTNDAPTATKFSHLLAEGTVEGRAIFRTTIPADRILSTPGSGYGCLHEYEWVVLDTPGQVEVTLKAERY